MVGATAGSVGLYTESAAGFVPVLLLLLSGGADFLPQPVVAIPKMTRKVAAVLIFVLIIFAFQSWVTVDFPFTIRALFSFYDPDIVDRDIQGICRNAWRSL